MTPPRPPLPDADAALFLDADGTLLDIAPTPDAIVVPDGLVEILRDTAQALSGAVAIVSGRRLAELRKLFGKAGVVLIGEHGAAASIALPSLAKLRHEEPPPALIASLRRFADRLGGTLLELKAHGAALHVRNAPAAAAAAQDLTDALAAKYARRVRLLRGKAVFEFAAIGVSKGHAVAAMLRDPPFRSRMPFFAGDDVTDEDGFAVVNRLGGVSVRIGPAHRRGLETVARFRIASPARFRHWLAQVPVALRSAADRAPTERR